MKKLKELEKLSCSWSEYVIKNQPKNTHCTWMWSICIVNLNLKKPHHQQVEAKAKENARIY